ncbi:phosphotransferase family protein [Aspergillus oryzae 100-8]|uniref:Altered inheritance of mitochondria protein 9, mitochondrial n=1 Tax=Aspergillus oryzae (strain 3.042) TaxID=1160506 RepID=I8TWS7_ASPO3|nr:phosphotransferase family protein [Aspergillus oryzae 3.042]KDE82420.1 phosphotransferase family protein [Aspergillus oryzae 100-8]|eukprot:EIT78678.1 phosphotransferase family protein [Aspergillus oryzae 3.042]
MLRRNRSILSNSSNLSRETFLLPLSSRCYSYQHPQLQMANIVGNPQDFFRYTSGRWIWDERQQLRERYREFDILEVQKLLRNMAKIGEGSYNKSFKLTMGNGKTVIARILNLNTGPAFLTTALEVTLMDFITIFYLPVFKVLAWNSAIDSINRVGAEYIIIEHAPGKNLADVWIEMDLGRKIQTMEDIIWLPFLYRKDAPPGSYFIIVEGDNLSHKLKYNIAEIFSIGPMVDTAIQRASTIDYIQNNSAKHVSLLQRYLSVAPHLIPQEQDILGGYITSIIDWQSARAGPLFLEGRHPDFLDYNGDLMLELPENFKQLDENTQSAVKDKVTNSILLYLYENYTVERNPILSKVFQYPNGKTITDPIRFVGNTWDGDILKWDLLYRIAKCPIDFSSEEICKHYEDGEGWNEVQDFWDALSGILSKDGWTSHATYDQALSIYSQIQAHTAPHSSHNALPKK